jgi:predicted DNA-binding protein YlxM (UPF0122 family)
LRKIFQKLLTKPLGWGKMHCQAKCFTEVEMSEKNFIYSILYDYYGDLLKENQATIIEMYYNLDYSLSEIAEEMNISRQGVHDALKRAEKNLIAYEQKIKLHDKYMKYSRAAENIIKLSSEIDDEKYKDLIEKIRLEAAKIINEG